MQKYAIHFSGSCHSVSKTPVSQDDRNKSLFIFGPISQFTFPATCNWFELISSLQKKGYQGPNLGFYSFFFLQFIQIFQNQKK